MSGPNGLIAQARRWGRGLSKTAHGVRDITEDDMNHSPTLVSIFAALCVLATVNVATPARAQAAQPEQPMALRGVMERLGRDMQAVTGAISKEDWALVAELAPRIAQHEQPPAAEKVRILGWLGSDAARFRSLDGEVEHAAMALGEAARRGDGPAVIAAFGKIQHSCLACHQSYRKAFVEQFYGRR